MSGKLHTGNSSHHSGSSPLSLKSASGHTSQPGPSLILGFKEQHQYTCLRPPPGVRLDVCNRAFTQDIKLLPHTVYLNANES